MSIRCFNGTAAKNEMGKRHQGGGLCLLGLVWACSHFLLPSLCCQQFLHRQPS